MNPEPNIVQVISRTPLVDTKDKDGSIYRIIEVVGLDDAGQRWRWRYQETQKPGETLKTTDPYRFERF